METIFDRAFSHIKDYKVDKENGEFNAIPPPFPRLADAFPGWERGLYAIITANSGVGKTKVSKFFIITSIMRFAEQHPELDINILWYALEESETEFALSFMSTMLATNYGIKLSPSQLRSLGNYTISDQEMDKIEIVRKYLNKFLSKVTVIDNISNPYGIWKDVRAFASKRGKFSYQGQEIDPSKGFDNYTSNNPKEFVFVVTDHISLLHREKGQNSDYETIGKFSKEYCLNNMVKRLNYSVINIQQQVSDQEKMQYTFKGTAIEEKVEPTLDGLANNKETQRDADLVIGIFAPTRYGINTYPGANGYKINPAEGGFGDRYRCLKFLKDRRYGLANKRVHAFFNGAINFLVELPKPNEMTEEKYKEFLTKY